MNRNSRLQTFDTFNVLIPLLYISGSKDKHYDNTIESVDWCELCNQIAFGFVYTKEAIKQEIGLLAHSNQNVFYILSHSI